MIGLKVELPTDSARHKCPPVLATPRRRYKTYPNISLIRPQPVEWKRESLHCEEQLFAVSTRPAKAEDVHQIKERRIQSDKCTELASSSNSAFS